MYRKTTLPNGLRIVTHDVKNRNSIAIGFWIGVGGRYEDDGLKGAAHFLEHVVFKGSRKYNCAEIKERIEGVGGALNAFTTEEQTCYYAKIPARFLDQTFDVLSDMVFFPKLKQKDIKQESTVILEEIKMYHDLSQYYVLELLDQLSWPNHPLGKGLAGTPETVSGMTNKDLKTFHRHYYAPQNVVIVACGKLSHKKIVDLARSKLHKADGGGAYKFIKANGTLEAAKVKCINRDIKQIHLALGMPGYSESHKDRYALSLLNVILGANMSSRLFVEVREKKGLAYSISSSFKPLQDTGIFFIRAGLDQKNLMDTMKLILKVINNVVQKGVQEAELKRAKDYLIGQIQLGLEDTMEHMLWLGESMIVRNRAESIQRIVEKLKRVNRRDINRVAKYVLNKRYFKLALVGPIPEKKKEELSRLIGIS